MHKRLNTSSQEKIKTIQVKDKSLNRPKILSSLNQNLQDASEEGKSMKRQTQYSFSSNARNSCKSPLAIQLNNDNQAPKQ